MIVIILYITVAFPNHSSRRLLANQKPTTLRKNVAKLNETSLRYFKLILDPERSNQIYRFAIYRGIYLLIIEKLFNCSLSLSLFDLLQIILYCPYVHNIIFVILQWYWRVVSRARGKRIAIRYVFIHDLLLPLLRYVMYVINELCMIHDIVNPLWSWRSRNVVVEDTVWERLT